MYRELGHPQGEDGTYENKIRRWGGSCIRNYFRRYGGELAQNGKRIKVKL
jgi:hypothetical protein